MTQSSFLLQDFLDAPSLNARDLVRITRKIKRFIAEKKVLRLSRYECLDGIHRLTICNLWRIERLPDGSIRTYEFDLFLDSWKEVAGELKTWPNIPFYAFHRTRGPGPAEGIVHAALKKIFNESGISRLNIKKGVYKRIRNSLFDYYLGKSGIFDGMVEPHPIRRGILKWGLMAAACRSLWFAFFRYFHDREVLSAMLCIDFWDRRFTRYLGYARHRTGLLKVAREHRNLLPLLRGINPHQWALDDLFSRKLWVRGDRKGTLLDRSGFRLTRNNRLVDSVPALSSFQESRAWRWLSKASLTIVREYTKYADPNIINAFAYLNFSGQAPACAYASAIRLLARMNRFAVSHDPVAQRRLLGAFLSHAEWLWKERGYDTVRKWAMPPNGHEGVGGSEGEIISILDYLNAEGFNQGFPFKNSTWGSLIRRSDDWHRRVYIESYEKNAENLTWNSLVPETIIDGIQFTPLNESRALAIEGYELHHCVETYSRYCFQDLYRVYSVQEPDGSRSTLGIHIDQSSASFSQHVASRNASPSIAALEAGKKLIRIYQDALLSA